MQTAYITHPDCMLHEMGQWHPEQPARLDAIRDALHESQLMDYLFEYAAPLATEQQILLAHSQEYINLLKRLSPTAGTIPIDPDTQMNCHTLQAAYRSAGAGISGIDLIMQQEVKTVFCAVRPPGHHAERDRAMGFCFFNNVAIAARYALNHYDIKKLAILDFDVHHGNGTEKILSDDPGILICSTFQHPFYPAIPFESSNPLTVNAPLKAGSGSAEFRKSVEQLWVPAINTFAPELILISAGFDAHANDDMSDINLHTSDFKWVTDLIVSIADQHADGRILSTLEGGYDLPSLGASVVAHIGSLAHF